MENDDKFVTAARYWRLSDLQNFDRECVARQMRHSNAVAV
jgi:hypothetical protein